MSNGDASHEAPAADFQEGAVGNPTINKERRYFLIGATSAVAGLGVVGAAVPFVRFWNPSAKARALGAPVKIDISKLKPGEMLSPMPAWRGRPIFIVYRDADVVSVLESSELNLADPESDNADMQPEYARNSTRSTRPEIGIYVGICTHLGCSPKHVAMVAPENFGGGQGGFFCPCHGSRFDLAGRVGAGFPAPDNLEVPPHRYASDTVVIIGEEEGAA